MKLEFFIARLSQNAEAIQSLLSGVAGEQARWKPSPDEWSLLEVINHLYDEEQEDFRQRLDLTLHQPDQPWPDIDPQGWVVERGYNLRDLEASLENFLRERRRAVAWLASLSSPDWEARREHPQAGGLSAGDLLASWLAHDFLHLRQLVQLHWQTVSRLAEPYTTRYAGAW
ncbi:MAG: DinB family protein [Anaerolineae bacterium]|nr:MAG: DinB family protein [Anaerolineae bacterium]